VRLIRDLYARFAILIHEVIKFGIVGAIGVVVTFGVTDALRFEVHAGPVTSATAGYVVATAVTFVGNRYWAFSHRSGGGLGRETVLFALFNVVALGIQDAVIAIAHYGMGMTDPLSYNVALVIGVVLGTLFRLWSYRQWVFSTPHYESGAEEKEPAPVR